MRWLLPVMALFLLLPGAFAQQVQVDYYYQVGCSACAVFEKTLEQVESGGKYHLNVTKYEIRFNSSSFERFRQEATRLGIPEDGWATPTAVLDGSAYFVGAVSRQEFEEMLDKCLAGNCTSGKPADGNEGASLINPFTAFVAGLVSGFNPCLFAVLLFLITYSIGMSENKMRLVKLTVAFSFGIFAAYFIIGWGLLSVASMFDIKLLTMFVSAVVILLGLWTLRDYRNPKSILVETPENVKGMSESLTRKNSAFTAFLLGGLFSLVKAPCVGGIYLTVLNMASSSEMSVKVGAIPLLISYNFGLVFPLLLISLAVLLGVPPAAIEGWRERNKYGMRIALGAALILVGLLMLWQSGLI